MKSNQHLNNLDYKQPEYRPVKVSEWVLAVILTILIIVCVKECNSDKVALTVQELANKP